DRHEPMPGSGPGCRPATYTTRNTEFAGMLFHSSPVMDLGCRTEPDPANFLSQIFIMPSQSPSILKSSQCRHVEIARCHAAVPTRFQTNDSLGRRVEYPQTIQIK